MDSRAPASRGDLRPRPSSRVRRRALRHHYEDLDIAAGDTASAALEALLLDGDTISARGRSKMRAQLLAYCERDTFGMVRLVERLHELALTGRRDGSSQQMAQPFRKLTGHFYTSSAM